MVVRRVDFSLVSKASTNEFVCEKIADNFHFIRCHRNKNGPKSHFGKSYQVIENRGDFVHEQLEHVKC
jgi:hypothetical protein